MSTGSMLLRLLLVLAALVHFAAPATAQGWPFGAGGQGQRGGDFWNLGPLGAKAHTGAVSTVAADATGRTSVSGDVPFQDGGPAELVLAVVDPEGPAGRAGLTVGDVITGIGGKRFKEDESLEALADALVKARAKGELELSVEKGGEKSRVTITLPVGPEVGIVDKDPLSDEARRAAQAFALRFLAAEQSDDGGLPAGLSGGTGRVVNASLAGLAWISGGSTLEAGDFAENLVEAVGFVCAQMEEKMGQELPRTDPGQANWDQSNWSLVYAGLFLGEVHALAPSDRVKDVLAFIASDLVLRQEKSGGYAHGPGGPNALDYVELNIVGALALMAFGAAERAGVEIDEDAVDRLVEYLDDSSSGGGVGYSTGAGQQGMGNIARSAATWRGMVLVGRGKDGFAKQTKSYAKKEATNFLGGHASLMQHIFFGGIAAAALGGSDLKKWYGAMEREFVLAQAHDGSYQPRPFQETANLNSNGDVTMGVVWTTASWAILLALDFEDGGLPLMVGAD
jgi:hypothetical protein